MWVIQRKSSLGLFSESLGCKSGSKTSMNKRASTREWKWHGIIQKLEISKVENMCFNPRSSTTKAVLGGNLRFVCRFSKFLKSASPISLIHRMELIIATHSTAKIIWNNLFGLTLKYSLWFGHPPGITTRMFASSLRIRYDHHSHLTDKVNFRVLFSPWCHSY